MVIGTTLFKLDGTDYYSPQFSRGGLAATFAVDVTHVSGSPVLTIDIEHRNAEDTAWTSAGSFSGINAVGTHQKDISGLKEILRISYNVGGTAASDAVHFFMQAPSWRPYA